MAQASRFRPATPLWSPGNPLGSGLVWGTMLDAPGKNQRNYVVPGVSDVTIAAGTMGTGLFGRQLQLNGTNQYATAPLSAALQVVAPCSWAALASTNGSPGTYKYLLKCSLPSQNHVWGLGTDGSSKPWAFARQSGGSYLLVPATSYTWDTHYHLYAATYTSAGTLTFYVDGVPLATGSGDGTLYSYATAGPIVLGAVDDSGATDSFHWPGNIAAAYVWSRALSARDQLRLAQDPFAPFRRRPRAWLIAGVPYAGTLDADSQSAGTSLSATVSIPGTLGAEAQAATTSLAGTLGLTATLGATAEAAATAITSTVVIVGTLGMAAAEATVDLDGFWGVPLEITATATAAHTSLRVRWGRTPPASDQTDLLRVGLSLLTQTLKSTASQPVTYVRGLDSVDVRATFGRKLLKLDDGAGGIRMEWTDMDFLIPAADLVLAGSTIRPGRDDQIFLIAGSQVQEFVVASYGGEPPWRWSDPHQSMLRVHAKHVGSEPYDA